MIILSSIIYDHHPQQNILNIVMFMFNPGEDLVPEPSRKVETSEGRSGTWRKVIIIIIIINTIIIIVIDIIIIDRCCYFNYSNISSEPGRGQRLLFRFQFMLTGLPSSPSSSSSLSSCYKKQVCQVLHNHDHYIKIQNSRPEFKA